MSMDPFDDNGNENESSQKVTDEEGTVDQKVKARILKARERVDDAEAVLYVDAPTSDVQVTRKQMHLGYVTMVRQFIRAIKPLLTSPKIPQADYYYSEVPLFETEVPPPDKRYEWSKFALPDVDETKLKMEMGLRGVEPPRPKTVSVRGLNEVMTREEVNLQWSIDLNGGQKVAQSNMETLTRTFPLPKRVYDSAVEHADAFLQQAGVGLEIGHRQEDDPDDDPF